jgi:hypothetical protein
MNNPGQEHTQSHPKGQPVQMLAAPVNGNHNDGLDAGIQHSAGFARSKYA